MYTFVLSKTYKIYNGHVWYVWIYVKIAQPEAHLAFSKSIINIWKPAKSDGRLGWFDWKKLYKK
jgi:hypothetical protein